MRRRHTPYYRVLNMWLHVVARLVPTRLRDDWRMEWSGELRHGLKSDATPKRVLNVAMGLLSDARDVRRTARLTRTPTSRRGDPIMRQLLSDIRFGFRMFRRSPLFTAVVIVTIGLGVGATTSLFTVVNSVLLNPLPFEDADRLVNLWQGRRSMAIDRDWFSGAQYVDIQEGTDVFEDLVLGFGGTVAIRSDGAPQEVGYATVTSSLFSMLGVAPHLGRVFDASDDVDGAEHVLLLSHALWQGSYGGDPTIVGRSIRINDVTRRVVGVLPPGFVLTGEVMPTVAGGGTLDLFGTFQLSEARLTNRGSENYNLIGKLKAGATLAQAQSQLDAVAQSIIERFEGDSETGFFITVVPLLDDVVGSVRRPLIALLVAGIVLLAIACTNVVNLLLARSTQRQHELSVRAAMGALRPRLVRQLLTESMMLALAGCVAGVLLSSAGIAVLRRVGGATLPRLAEVTVDTSVLLVGILLATLTTVAFGLAPAVRASAVDPNTMIRAGGRGQVGRHGSLGKLNLSSTLVVLEIAMAMVLLTGAGLLVRSFSAIRDIDPGFDTDNVTTFRVRLLGDVYDDDARSVSFLEALEDRLTAVPDIQVVGGTHILPFVPRATWGRLQVEGAEADPELIAHYRIATPDYFNAMRIPLMRGRVFDRSDRADTKAVVIVEQQLADRLFPGQDPIGRRIEGWTTEWAEIVGVVGSVKIAALDDDPPLMAYYPLAQTPISQIQYAVRGALPGAVLGRIVEGAVRELDPGVLVADIRPLTGLVDTSLASRRFAMLVFQAFALTAMILAAVGIYGLVAYRVHLGSRELGMRLALGAQRRDILMMVVRHGMSLTAAGMTLGIVVSLGVTKLMSSMLFDVKPTDILTYVSVGVFLAFVAFVASLIPAGRAARLSPLTSLRGE